MIKKYYPRHVDYCAVRISRDNIREVLEFIEGNRVNSDVDYDKRWAKMAVVFTEKGSLLWKNRKTGEPLRVYEGDWLVKDPNGDFHLYTHEEFTAIYTGVDLE